MDCACFNNARCCCCCCCCCCCIYRLQLLEIQASAAASEAAAAAPAAPATQLETVTRAIATVFDEVAAKISGVAGGAAGSRTKSRDSLLGVPAVDLDDDCGIPGVTDGDAATGVASDAGDFGEECEEGDEGEEEVDEDAVGNETIHRLAPHYASQINSPLRHVRY